MPKIFPNSYVFGCNAKPRGEETKRVIDDFVVVVVDNSTSEKRACYTTTRSLYCRRRKVIKVATMNAPAAWLVICQPSAWCLPSCLDFSVASRIGVSNSKHTRYTVAEYPHSAKPHSRRRVHPHSSGLAVAVFVSIEQLLRGGGQDTRPRRALSPTAATTTSTEKCPQRGKMRCHEVFQNEAPPPYFKKRTSGSLRA